MATCDSALADMTAHPTATGDVESALESRALIARWQQQARSLEAMHDSHWQALLPPELACPRPQPGALRSLQRLAACQPWIDDEPVGSSRCAEPGLAVDAQVQQLLTLPRARLPRLVVCLGAMLHGDALRQVIARQTVIAHARVLGGPLVDRIRQQATLLAARTASAAPSAEALLETARRTGTQALRAWLTTRYPSAWTHLRFCLPLSWTTAAALEVDQHEPPPWHPADAARLLGHLLKLDASDPLWNEPLSADA